MRFSLKSKSTVDQQLASSSSSSPTSPSHVTASTMANSVDASHNNKNKSNRKRFLPPPPLHPPPRPFIKSDGHLTSTSTTRDNTPRSNSTSTNHTPLSTPTATTTTTTTINLKREFTIATQTNSYNDIWTKIHSPTHVATHSELLQPGHDAIAEALHNAKPSSSSAATLASHYFNVSEEASSLCLSLHSSTTCTFQLYSPLRQLLEILPHPTLDNNNSNHVHLSPPQLKFANRQFLAFHESFENPFPHPPVEPFSQLRQHFSNLRRDLDRNLHRTRRKLSFLRRTTRTAALCLVGATLAVTATAIVLFTHVIGGATVMAAAASTGPSCFFSLLPANFAKTSFRMVRWRVAQLDTTAKGVYVLSSDLDTIERLVTRVHETVESDTALVRMGVERGENSTVVVGEVVRQLRRSQPKLTQQLRDLEEHLCLCLATLNRARSQLLHQISLNAPSPSSNTRPPHSPSSL
ncbi:UPF0496 protein At3g19330 [Amborella trichopoda]|uniref:Uncharacterized protein n=1 Tax=Amborella trichopoda TaxID=13333 RepID=W1PN70_AMBTC|nr:UPF0496 protein At3g19330 [Amborella trichopoda]ERN11477.1 hypothetical protein AMTR_s00022p00096260 [Amborella trichopoda]|eukprot:XP_006849896.1 UPF0496 protein At3g19330 [Amborella trichopoda]